MPQVISATPESLAHKPPSLATNLVSDDAAFLARAQRDGFVDPQGFFAPQAAWEFELDTLQDTSRKALLAHLERGANHETAVFLKGYLLDANPEAVAFTPFLDDGDESTCYPPIRPHELG